MGRHKYTREQAVAAFWSKVEVKGPEDCWPWTGAINSWGYGAVVWEGRAIGAHCVAFSLSGGVLAEGEEVCHTCDNPPCCNPSHLFAGTHSTNMADCVSKNRRPAGIKHYNCRLTETQVIEIRNSSLSLRKLARQYGVSDAAIHYIKKGKTWKCLPQK